MLRFAQLYQNLVLSRPKSALFVMLIVMLAIFQGAKHFELDASAESLVLEGDQDLINYRNVAERFGSSEFLVVTYTPPWPLFSEASLSLLKEIHDELKQLPRVESMYSLLDVPLLENPPVPVADLIGNIKSLEHPEVDIEAAKQELANSPIYNDMLLNLEANTTAIQINRPFDERHRELTKAREALWKKQAIDHLSSEEKSKLAEIAIYGNRMPIAMKC